MVASRSSRPTERVYLRPRAGLCYTNPCVTSPVRVPDIAKRYRERLQIRFGERLESARVFGSYARYEATADSDLDIAVLVRGLTKAEKVAAIGDAAELGWPIGLKISPLLMTPEDFAQLAELEARLALDILSEGIPL